MLKALTAPADDAAVGLLLAFVVGWCLISAMVALGLGPLLHRAADLADRHEAPVVVLPDRPAA